MVNTIEVLSSSTRSIAFPNLVGSSAPTGASLPLRQGWALLKLIFQVIAAADVRQLLESLITCHFVSLALATM